MTPATFLSYSISAATVTARLRSCSAKICVTSSPAWPGTPLAASMPYRARISVACEWLTFAVTGSLGFDPNAL
jgi:hypothetical protein